MAATTSPRLYNADPLIDCLNKQFSLSSWESAIERFHFSMSELFDRLGLFIYCVESLNYVLDKSLKNGNLLKYYSTLSPLLLLLLCLFWQVSTRCSSYRIIRNENTRIHEFLFIFSHPSIDNNFYPCFNSHCQSNWKFMQNVMKHVGNKSLIIKLTFTCNFNWFLVRCLIL